ncbi:MAG: SOS response-associated peptidase [Gemmatimonadaceae bacterium]
MCGRFGLTRPERLDLQRFGVEHVPPLLPRFNIAPGSEILTITERDGGRVAELLRWGLVPSWAKEPSIGNRLANARSETVFEKPAFRSAIRSRRCLVLADVFYEWQVVPGQSRKQPHAIRMVDGEPFALGGLWEYWRPREGDGDPLVTCALLTTDANSLMTGIHDRMPVIVPQDQFGPWLDSRTPDPAVRDLMLPVQSELLEAWPVSLRVNNPTADDERVLEPVDVE